MILLRAFGMKYGWWARSSGAGKQQSNNLQIVRLFLNDISIVHLWIFNLRTPVNVL